jgi:hypothetical protein
LIYVSAESARAVGYPQTLMFCEPCRKRSRQMNAKEKAARVRTGRGFFKERGLPELTKKMLSANRKTSNIFLHES